MQDWPMVMQSWNEKDPAWQVDVLLFDHFSNHCLANAIEPLRAANTLSRKSLYRWRFLGIDGAPVQSSSGLPVTPEAALRHVDGGDCLIVMPSYGFRAHASVACLHALRAAARRYGMLVGMDTGAWLLAAAGLLDGRRATIHWDEIGTLAETFPEVEVISDRFTIDGNRLCCGGVTTAFDLILHLIGEQHGSMLALEVAALFMHGTREHASQYRATPDAAVHAVVSLMRRNIEAPLPIPEIAARAGLSRKRLETLFRDRLRMTPQTVYRAIRLREARRLAEYSRQSISEIASRCGYDDATAMTRAFRSEFGCTPTSLRGSGL